MLGGDSAPGASLGPHDHRHFGSAAEHIAVFGGGVDELIHCDGKKVTIHHFGHRPHSRHGGAGGGAGDCGLGDGGIAHALITELFPESARGAVGPAVYSNIFPHDKDALVA